jgi:hypothetical protein
MMAFFALKPRKQCRIICKEGTREVYGNKESMCLSNEAFRAVIMSKDVQQGSCQDGEQEYIDTTGAKTCIGIAFVNDIRDFF